MEKIAIIGARSIPKNFWGTSGVESYIEQQLPVLTQDNEVDCYIRSWATNHAEKRLFGANLIRILSPNSTYLDTISYSFFASIHASFSGSTIVWYHGMGPAVFSFIPKVFNKRVFTTIHTLDWKRKKWNIFAQLFLKLCEQIAFLNSDTIIVVSKSLKLHYEQQGKTGVLLQKYKLIQRSKILTKHSLDTYHLKNNSYILYVGRFVPEKRLEWLVKASCDMTMPIVMVGGSSHTEAYEAKIRRLAIGRNILFTGYLFGKQKDELISHCKVFVLPSQTEGYPVSVVEALELQAPCLVGDFLRSEFGRKPLLTYFKSDDYDNFLTKLRRAVS